MQPVMRQVYVVEMAVQPTRFLPAAAVDAIIHEGHGKFITAHSFPDDPVTTTDFSWQRHKFEERIWPQLAEFLPLTRCGWLMVGPGCTPSIPSTATPFWANGQDCAAFTW